MWTWLGIAVLARVLMASHEVDQYPSTGSFSDRVMAEVMEGELTDSTIKPAVIKNGELSQWKDDSKIYRGISPCSNSISGLITELSSPGPKLFRKMEKGQFDERRKRSSAKQREPLTPGSWISWITLENKALPVRDSQDPWQEIKKSRAFSPWGGKRVAAFGQGQKVRRPIRVPFNSWGGKRSFPGDQKRTRFSSWGGKRGWYIGVDENSVENSPMEKRTKFNAWGGKRSKNGERDDEEVKRTRFNAWGGKRNFKIEKRMPDEIGAKKSVFNAWGGKRFYTGYEINPLGYEKGLKYGRWNGRGLNMPEKKPAAGYRIQIDDINSVEKVEEQEQEEGEGEEEGDGKEENGEKQVLEDGAEMDNKIPSKIEITESPDKNRAVDYEKKSLFNPWGGKKRGENDADEIMRGLHSIFHESSGLQGHHYHERFWPWGG